jgi:Xaa-Pro dipeptidase
MHSVATHSRIAKVQEALAAAELDAVFVTNPANIGYVAGFRANPMERLIALLVGSGSEPLRLVLPALEEEAGRNATPDATVIYPWTDADGPRSAVEKAFAELSAGARVGIERTHLTVAYYELVGAVAPNATLVDADPTLTRLRAVKDDDELDHRRAAARIVDAVVEHLAASELKPGRTEAELAAECARLSREAGADAIAGDPQVVTGARSAMPHGHSSQVQLEQGDLVIVDLAASSGGYFADISRTFVLGEPAERQRELFQTVHEAQLAAIRAALPGTAASDVDRAARSVIAAAGLGDYFIHRVGHGLGVEVHEPPSLSSTNIEPLRDGMTVTIEPGVYVPGYGGARIEDDIVVRRDGAEVLTQAPIKLEVEVGDA